MRPGVTQRPLASTRVAPSGTATSVPTASIFPSRSTTVAFSSFGPDTGYTVPPVMAIVCARTGPAKRKSDQRERCMSHRPTPGADVPRLKSVRYCRFGSFRSNTSHPSLYTCSALL